MISYNKLGLNGNIGNQLFQYAVTRTLAKKRGWKFYVPYWIGDAIFKLNDSSLKGDEFPVQYIFHEDEEVFDVPERTSLYGFYQTEKYFLYPEDVKKYFTFIEPIMKIGSSFDAAGSVGVSIRRGDYMKFTNMYNPVWSKMSYYRQGLELVLSKAKVKKIIVFSDDMRWCKGQLQKEIGYLKLPIHFADRSDIYMNLHIMTLCEHLVIPNSTYAWWGAWLNPKPNKIVVAPKKWYIDGCGVYNNDINCKDWIEIDI